MSKVRSYDLLSEAWIPVVWRNDAAQPNLPKIGIREGLQRAQGIQCVSHTAPFIEFGLYRLLITIVLDASVVARQRPTVGRLRQMLEAREFDWSILEPYLDRYKNAFDLWDNESPFLQRKVITDKRGEAVVRMLPAIPSGTNVVHWNHYTEDETEITEEAAAQFLTTVSPWNFKTKPGEARTLAGDPPMYAVVVGQSLFETIVLNLPRLSGRVATNQERDRGPVWRTPLDDPSRLPKAPTLAQGFTWPVRVIRLENEGGMVAKAINQAAYSKATDKAKAKGANVYDAKYGWRDPNAGIETTKDAIRHITARPGIPIWRDAVPLFLVGSEGETLGGERRRSRPEVITNALRVLDRPQFRVAVYGMRKKSGGGDVKVEEWFRSVLTLPTEVARDSRLSARAFDAFKTTQKVADDLQTALRMLRPPVKATKRKRPPPGRGDTDVLGRFWQRLEPVLRGTYLDELVSDALKPEDGLWESVRQEARDAFRRATGPHRRTADGLFRIANAGNWLEGRLNRLLPRPLQESNP